MKVQNILSKEQLGFNELFFCKHNGYDGYTGTALIVMLFRVKNSFLFKFCSKVVSYFCKYSVVKHSILFMESLLAQIFTINKTCYFKGFSSISKSFSPS